MAVNFIFMFEWKGGRGGGGRGAPGEGEDEFLKELFSKLGPTPVKASMFI